MNLEKTIGTKMKIGLGALALIVCAGCPPKQEYEPLQRQKRYEENSKIYDEQTKTSKSDEEDETLIFLPAGDGVLIPFYF